MSFELLENRKLLSVSISHGVLIVRGTDGGDVITVSAKNHVSLVTVNGNRRRITKAYRRISIDAMGGDDSVYLASTVQRPVVVRGGDGDDTLLGTQAMDTLVGDAGDDTLSGAAEMHGGDGNDTLTGARTGNGNLFGNAGDDVIRGSGNASIDGGAGNDRITHDWGHADLKGGEGNDTITGDGYGDTLDLSARSNAARVDLASGIVTFDRSADADAIAGINIVIGTVHDDTFIGRGDGFPVDDEPLFIHGNGGRDVYSDFSMFDSTGA